MMIVYLVDENGRYIQELSGTADQIVASVPDGFTTVVIAPQRDSDYWNGSSWVDIGTKPAHYMEFDYATKTWTDTRNLADVQKAKWNQVKVARDIFEFSGFTYNGDVFDSDLQSQIRVMGAVTIGAPTIWTLKSNELVSLDDQGIVGLGQALADHIQSAHERGRAARKAIYDSTSPEQVDAVIF